MLLAYYAFILDMLFYGSVYTSEDVHCLLSEVLWDTRVSFAQILHQYVGPGMRIFDNPPGHKNADQAMTSFFSQNSRLGNKKDRTVRFPNSYTIIPHNNSKGVARGWGGDTCSMFEVVQ